VNILRASFVVLWLALAGAMPAWSATLTLPELLTSLSQVRTGDARFVEKRRVQALEQTLEYSGRLSFKAPDVFVRETLKPRPERLAVDGNTLTMSQGSRSRTVQLDTVPEAQVMVEAIRGTLTGNAAVLDKHFQTQLSGSAERWTLELVPKDFRLRELVSRIEIGGRQALVLSVALQMADGDQSVMTIEPAAASVPAAAI